MAIRMITGADLETEVREFTFTPEELAVYAEQAEALRNRRPYYAPTIYAPEVYGVSGFGIDMRVRRIR